MWAGVTFVVLGLLIVDLFPQIDALLSLTTSHEDMDLAGKTLADCTRVLGVILSMLMVLCALAVPLTANVYTPKLISLFVADRRNQFVFAAYVLALVFVLYNKYIVANALPEDAHARVLICLVVTVLAALSIAPVFLSVLGYLVPSTIVARLEREIRADLRRAQRARDAEELDAAHDVAIRNVQYLGKIVLRSTERHERESAYAGLAALRSVFDTYQLHKSYLPQEALRHPYNELHGLSPELALEVERRQATLEVAILQELSLVLPVAMERLPQVVARVAALTRHFGVRAAERRDDGVREMVTLHFNTFLRQALKARDADAFYKFSYQYRRFAEDLLDIDPAGAKRVAFFLDYYGHQAVRMRLGYLINVVAYDLAEVVDLAFRKRSPARQELLDVFSQLDRDEASLLEMPGVVKAQIILAAKLRTRSESEPVSILLGELRKVHADKLAEAFAQIVATLEPTWWEIADRRRHLDHVEPRFRPAIDALRRELLGDQPVGPSTARFMDAAQGLRRSELIRQEVEDLRARTGPVRIGDVHPDEAAAVEAATGSGDEVVDLLAEEEQAGSPAGDEVVDLVAEEEQAGSADVEVTPAAATAGAEPDSRGEAPGDRG
jgi:hypothetical protein